MIRLAWRQMRWHVVTTAALLVPLVLFLIVTRWNMVSFMDTSGLGECLSAGGECDSGVNAFLRRFNPTLGAVGVLAFVPLLIGVFWAAPLIAREVEMGTHRLVWTQCVSRWRWFSVRIAVLVAIATAAVVAVTAVFAWWSQPFLRIGGSLSAINPPFYVLGGTVLIATTLFAIAVGVVASALIRRVVPAMAATVAVFLGPWLLLQQSRYELLPPHRLTYAPNLALPRTGLGDWTPEEGLGMVDPSGNTITYEAMMAACPAREVDGIKGGLVDPECLAASGFRYEYVYQPLERFWPLQAVESGILIAAATVLFALAAWWTTRRIT